MDEEYDYVIQTFDGTKVWFENNLVVEIEGEVSVDDLNLILKIIKDKYYE